MLRNNVGTLPSALSPKSKKRKKNDRVRFNLIQARNTADHATLSSSVCNPKSAMKVIKPNSKVNLYAEKFKVAMLLFSVWSTPFRLGWPGSFAVFIGVVDWLFFFDIVRNFLTGYIDENGNQVMKLKEIAKVYSRTSGLFDKRVKSSFWLDIMSLVPSYIVQFLRSNGTITGKNEIIFMALALSPQIDRCLSLLSHFRMMELSVNSDVRRIALMKFLVTLFGAAHWVGCSWWILAEFYEFDESTWVYRYFERFLPEVPGTSASSSLLVRYGFEGVIDQYELSLYWGFQALTNLGYSDILPDNSTEMVYAYILCMTQVAFYAYVLGNSTLFSLSKRDQTSDAFVKKLNLIEVYCQSRQLPVEVMKKMKGYYEFQSQKIDLEETKVMGKMPSSIFSKISLHKYGHHILNCPIFASPPPQFVTGIVASLRQKYLMPKEKLFRKGDMSREVCFVSSGSLEVYGDEEGKTFLNTVKNDGLSPTICGDLSFFLVIPQPHMVMASGESDVSLFSMSKINYTKCLEKYPESQHLIVTSLLAQMGLDTNGNELTDDVTEGGGKKKKKGAATAGGDDDDSFAALKSTVCDALKKRLAAALYGMMDAAREGDAERVKAMLMRGLDINATDYDHRTTLHLACAEGNLKVVELLIAEGANVHAIDRYGNNGLHYAVVNNHSLIADLLSRNGAELNYKREADVICGAAGVGNMDRIRVLVKYGIDVNSGDFDGRTALHLASSEGNLRVVELLLSMEADVNKKDRWGHTPLSDAVGKGHDLVAAALFARGGELNMKAATSDFMKASREGDLAKLKLFVENGINVDCVDYDISTALHVAAIADQPVAVDFLLSAKANVNAKSRWGTSPLDEAIASESVYCCKLIAACGGKAFVNAMAPFATEVAESEVCLETIRRDISNECVTQSKRSRAMHKLKQLHAKLMEDVSSSCETLARQCKSIETSTTKLGSSRLTGVGAKDQFKEADLEFDDGEDEEDRAQDSVLLNLLGGNTCGGGTGSGDDDEGFAGPPDDSNYMLNRFLHSPSSGWRRASEARNKGSYFNGPNSPGGDLQSLGRDVPQTVVAGAGEVKPGDRTFTTMNQVMLSFAKIEAGFSDLKGIFDTYAEGNYKNQVNVFELESILKSSGIANVSEPAKDIMAQCGGADLSETEDFSASERSSDKSQIKRAAGAEADQFISFKELISSNTTFELFMYEENYVTKCVNKIGLTFQLARATFNLLDTGNEGCVNVRKLRQNESIMGELGYGEELFNCFGGLEVIYPVDMVVVLARWTSFVDDEDANNQGKEPVADANDNLSLEGGDSDDHSTHGSEDKDLDGFVKEKKEEDVVEKKGWKGIITKFRPGSRKKLEDELLKRLSFDYADNIEGIFSAYDVDNSGDIDKDEFTEMVHHLFGEKSFSKSDIERSFEYFDVDSTGELLKHVFQKKLLDFRDSAETASETTSNQLKEEETTKLHQSRGLVFDADTSYVVKTSNTFMTIAAFFYFLFVPYEICFIHNTTGSNSVEVRNIGWIFDCILYFDMFISFHTTYVNHRSVKVTNVVKIRKHYLAHGFAYDMIASLPFDFIALFAFGASYSVLRWFRVPRLLRCVDIGKCFKRMRSNANKNKDRITVELTVFAFLLFALTHLPACAWFFLTDNDNEDTVLHNSKIETSVDGYWFSGYGATSSDGWKFEQYMLSLYWVTGTISTMGQGAGELMPQNGKERVFTIFLMLLNLSIYAYILGAISQLFMIADEALVEVREEVTLIESYLAKNNFGGTLQGEIRDTVQGGAAAGGGGSLGKPGKGAGLALVSNEDAKAIYDSLSHTLKVEVAKHTCYNLLINANAFQGCHQNFMESISTVLTEETFKPNTYIFRVNEPSTDFYLVASGAVYIVEDGDENDEEKEGKVGKEQKEDDPIGENNSGIVGEGDVMGEIPFFFDTRHTSSARTYKKGFVKAFKLPKDRYKRLLEIYPDEEEQIGKNVLSNSSSLTLGEGGGNSDADSEGGGSSIGASSDGASSINDGNSEYSASSAGSRASSDHGKTGKLGEIAKAVERARKRETNERVFAMCSASANGNLEELKKLCSSGVSLMERGYGGRTPLHLAASEGQLKVVMWIVGGGGGGVDVNVKDDEGHSALVDAVENGHDDLAKYLRSQGAELDVDFGATMLSSAACDNDAQKLHLLFELGVDPNVNVAGRVRGGARRRRSALHFAASGGNTEAVKLLMDNWANLNPFDGYSGTPLADSIREGHIEVQMLLRDAGAKLKEKGLCTAAACGDLETIKVMVMNGVDINIGNYIGRTMLHLACSNKHMNVIDYLLQLPGIDPNVIDWYEGTPGEDARRGGHFSVIAALKEVGGVMKGDPSLSEQVSKIKLKRVVEKEKFYQKREEQKEKDKLRQGMLDELTMLCKIAMEDIVDIRRLLDALNMSLAGRTWKKKESIDKAPKPELEEIVRHFLGSFQKFMIRKHALKLLKLYQFCVEFCEWEGVDVYGAVLEDADMLDEMMRIGQLEYDRYLDPLSPDFVAINPTHSQNAKDAVFDSVGLCGGDGGTSDKTSDDDEESFAEKKIASIRKAFQQIRSDIANVLKTKYVTEYFSSKEFHEVATSSSGRTFRVLKMCRRARTTLLRLESEVAVPMQNIVKSEKLNNDMYGGAKQFSLTMSETSIDFQQRLLDVIERIEVAALTIKNMHEKGMRKKNLLKVATNVIGAETARAESPRGNGKDMMRRKSNVGGGGSSDDTITKEARRASEGLDSISIATPNMTPAGRPSKRSLSPKGAGATRGTALAASAGMMLKRRASISLNQVGAVGGGGGLLS